MKKYQILALMSVMTFCGIVFQGCKKEEEEEEPTIEQVSYASDVASIMSNYCLTCHSGADPEAGLTLDNYDDVRAIGENGKLESRTNDADDPMPTSGLMSADKRKKLKDWIAGGYQ